MEDASCADAMGALPPGGVRRYVVGRKANSARRGSILHAASPNPATTSAFAFITTNHPVVSNTP